MQRNCGRGNGGGVRNMGKEENWKEQILAKYAELEKELTKITNLMYGDSDLGALILERELIDKEIEQANKGYIEAIEGTKQQQVDLKVELVDNWRAEDKTFACVIGTATLRTTRSLQIKNKGKLIDFLTTLKKLPEFIKSFEVAKLRKIKDAGLLEDELATYDEKKSVVIKIKGVDK